MIEHETTNWSQPTPPGQRAYVDWISAHHRILVLVAIAVVILAGVGFGVSLSTLAFLGIVLICPLMMLGMMVGMREMHGGNRTRAGSGPALDILRERYARGD